MTMTTRPKVPPLLSTLWKEFQFTPNPEQEAAILHAEGPLFLPAGPGSGKTRVLLWRTVNLIVTHGVAPDEIFLSTFTEKAALQLKHGLRALLSAVSEKNGQPYDDAKLYVGTVHSLCQRLLLDRRFSTNRSRAKPPIILDELDQYMFLRRQRNWDAVLEAAGDELSVTDIITIFGDRGTSRHTAITRLIGFFNRLSEEMINPAIARKRTKDQKLRALLDCYETYLGLLSNPGGLRFTDLSLVQQVTVEQLQQNPASSKVFRHVIIDEYQDTNPVQEKLFFQLAGGHKNLCVVGDDDQALYRFRGATVENFVDFSDRCKKLLTTAPYEIVLGTNYRSRGGIVDFYNRFIVHSSCDWKRDRGSSYRVMNKKIIAHRKESNTAVIASSAGTPADVAEEIASIVDKLIKTRKVEDPNQIAFLFPSLKSAHVERMREALANLGHEVYAPRAGSFLEVPEAVAVFGLLFQVFGAFEHLHTQFQDWLDTASQAGAELMDADPFLRKFIEKKRLEVKEIAADHAALAKVVERKKWDLKASYNPDTMPNALAAAPGLSVRAQRAIKSGLFERFVRERIRQGGKPFTLGYAVTRATTLDWNVLDFFYHLSGFRYFKKMFDLAENGKDEGPVCNLSLITQYLARFLDQYPFPISGENLGSEQFLRLLANFLYVLFRRGESEYEDANDPFPKGRIPFITIHQSKGLEFPVVVLGNPRKDAKLQHIETMVAPLLARQGEPPDRMPTFDVMRMFYVALSRAKNLLVIAHYRGTGQRMNAPFMDYLDQKFPRIPDFKISTMPSAKLNDQPLPQSYSYTGDFLLYRKCARQYMLFRKYGFVPSRSQTMFFGSLVHQTLEDLHQHLIGSRRAA